MKPNLLKYKIGLVILALLTVGLVGFVLVQASATKQDTKTNGAANSIADKLNNYITTHNVVPSTLAQAGAKNVPSSITYQKLSATSYKFCATYKSASSGFDAANAVVDVASGGTADTGSGSFTDTSSLFIDTTYHKGANCQTIKPYIAQTQPDSCAGVSAICQGSYATNNTLTAKQQATASGKQASACDIDGFKTHYSGVIKSVKTSDGSPIVPTASQTIIVTIQPNGDTPKGLQTVTLAPLSGAAAFNIYDSTCTTHDASSIQAGNDVSVFLDNPEPNMPNAMVDFSQ